MTIYGVERDSIQFHFNVHKPDGNGSYWEDRYFTDEEGLSNYTKIIAENEEEGNPNIESKSRILLLRENTEGRTETTYPGSESIETISHYYLDKIKLFPCKFTDPFILYFF